MPMYPEKFYLVYDTEELPVTVNQHVVTVHTLVELADDLGDFGDERQHTSKPCFVQEGLLRAA